MISRRTTVRPAVGTLNEALFKHFLSLYGSWCRNLESRFTGHLPEVVELLQMLYNKSVDENLKKQA